MRVLVTGLPAFSVAICSMLSRRYTSGSCLRARAVGRRRYGKSKLAAERIALRYTKRFRVTVLRPPALYGPGEHRMVALFRAAERGFVPMVHPRGTLSMLSGADCANAIGCALTEAPASGVYYVAEPRPYIRREMAEHIARAVGREPRVISISPTFLRAVGATVELAGRLTNKPVMLSRDKAADATQPHQSCDPRRAMRALGWAPKDDFATGARHAYEDYQARGWL